MVIFAALELVQELAEYLSARYPDTFQVERHIQADVDPKSFIQKGWGAKPPVKSVTIAPLAVTYQLNQNAEDMMKVAALLYVFVCWVPLRAPPNTMKFL